MGLGSSWPYMDNMDNRQRQRPIRLKPIRWRDRVLNSLRTTLAPGSYACLRIPPAVLPNQPHVERPWPGETAAHLGQTWWPGHSLTCWTTILETGAGIVFNIPWFSVFQDEPSTRQTFEMLVMEPVLPISQVQIVVQLKCFRSQMIDSLIFQTTENVNMKSCVSEGQSATVEHLWKWISLFWTKLKLCLWAK